MQCIALAATLCVLSVFEPPHPEASPFPVAYEATAPVREDAAFGTIPTTVNASSRGSIASSAGEPIEAAHVPTRSCSVPDPLLQTHQADSRAAEWERLDTVARREGAAPLELDWQIVTHSLPMQALNEDTTANPSAGQYSEVTKLSDVSMGGLALSAILLRLYLQRK